jgi:hypothetical protein
MQRVRSQALAFVFSFLGSLISSTLAAQAAPQQPAAAAGGAFSETTQVTAVEIPVQVVRDGEPVRGLTAADFAISEAGKPRAIGRWSIRCSRR